MGTAYNANIVTDGLVLCLDAANPRSYPLSGTSWNDLSWNGNNATLVNGPTFNSNNGGSVVFDASDEYGYVSSSGFQSGNNSFSMECWFMWFGGGINNVLFGYGSDTAAHRVPVIAIVSSKFHFEFGSGSGVVSSNTTTQTNTWYHGFAVYDKTTTKVYLNGIFENSTNYSSANIILNGSNGTNAGIGCLFSQYGNITTAPRRYGTFNGSIALLRYYNRPLTPQEIRQNFNATRGRYGY